VHKAVGTMRKDRKRLGRTASAMAKAADVAVTPPVCDWAAVEHRSHRKTPFPGFLIIVMTYKRVERLEKLLEFIKAGLDAQGHLGKRKNTDVIITQSCDSEEPETIQAVVELVQKCNSEGWFRSIQHVKTPLMPKDDSFSNNKHDFGSKRNALQNLKNGLSGALETFPESKDVVVLEDDAILSCDTFSMFQAMRGHGQQPPNGGSEEAGDTSGSIVWGALEDSSIVGGSSHVLFRPSLFVGHLDETLSDTVFPTDPKRIIVAPVNARSTIKTFAYILNRDVVREYLASLDQVDTDANSFEPGGFFYECPFCEPYCYDHVLEWMLQGRNLYVPDVPRVTQTQGQGMTYSENPLTPIYQRFVPQHEFYVSTLKWSLPSYFPIVGTSSLTAARPFSSLVYQVGGRLWFWCVFVAVFAVAACACGRVCPTRNRRHTSPSKWWRLTRGKERFD
jgi:hypothetical protein